MQTEYIYGIDYAAPTPALEPSKYKWTDIIGDQVWVRTPIPESFEDIEFDDEGNAITTPEQEEFILQELDRIKHGHYFFNRGELTYITGHHYFYLQYFTLEDGTIPEYRDSDRKWFLFFDYCYSKPYITGIIRIKKRREGATSQAASILLCLALTQPMSNCGIISKTNKDASDVFTKMVVNAYQNLPVFLQPRVEDDNPKTQLVFAKPKNRRQNKQKIKGQLYNRDRGLQSRIDYRATALNSYDSGRVSMLLCDEAGKWNVEVPINQYWPIVKKTLTQGIKRVGFALIVSTVNDAETGGAAYKEIWDDSNQFKNKITGTGLYRYFSPAYEGFPGFIDKYGHSITENASAEMRRMFLETYGEEYDGSKDYLMKIRARITDPVALSEERRMNPFDEREAFMISESKSHFNTQRISQRMAELEEDPPNLRQGRFYRKEDESIGWMDEAKGPWFIYKFPPVHKQNRRIMTDKGWGPANTDSYANGIDPHRHTFVKGSRDLSKTCCWIGEKVDQNDPENTGMPIAMYLDRPKLKEYMYEQMLFAAMFYGCKLHFETDASDDFYMWLKVQGLTAYVRWTPTCAINPLNPGKRLPGTSSKDPFALAKQLELCIAFIEHHCHKIMFYKLLVKLLEYDHEDRQVHDMVVAFMIMLLDLAGDTKPINQDKKINRPIVKTYNLLKGNDYN